MLTTTGIGTFGPLAMHARIYFTTLHNALVMSAVQYSFEECVNIGEPLQIMSSWYWTCRCPSFSD